MAVVLDLDLVALVPDPALAGVSMPSVPLALEVHTEKSFH